MTATPHAPRRTGNACAAIWRKPSARTDASIASRAELKARRGAAGWTP